MFEEVISFEEKLSLFIQDFERETLLHFQSLLMHRQEHNSSIDKYYFKTTICMREAFINRFQEFKNSRTTLAFVKNLINATIKDSQFFPFGFDISNFEILLLGLKIKKIWSYKFECLSFDVEILEKYELISQHKWTWSCSTSGIVFLTLMISWKNSRLLFSPFSVIIHIHANNLFQTCILSRVNCEVVYWWKPGIVLKIKNKNIQTWRTQTFQEYARTLFALSVQSLPWLKFMDTLLSYYFLSINTIFIKY